jgi:hypothetical protein
VGEAWGTFKQKCPFGCWEILDGKGLFYINIGLQTGPLRENGVI